MTSLNTPCGRVLYDYDHLKSQHADVFNLLPEAFERVGNIPRYIAGSVLAAAVEMGRIVGESHCVPTFPNDEIVYAKRVGRSGLTRFVVGRSSLPCSSVALILKRTGTNCKDIRLITAFVGRPSTPEPWDQHIQTAKQQLEANRFWNNHALVWGTQQTTSDMLRSGTQLTRSSSS